VKNNLQTVAALLRLQARRSDSAPVRHTLAESVRRVSSIALVHETLSTSPDDRVDLDQIVDRLVPMLSDVAAAESPARVRRDGSFGSLSADLATPLVMVLAEIVQNALQHGYPPGSLGGEVTIRVRRSARELDIRVVDDGRGLPAAFSLERARGLGLQIVRTLVDSELGGSIGMHRPVAGAGTEVTLIVPLRGPELGGADARRRASSRWPQAGHPSVGTVPAEHRAVATERRWTAARTIGQTAAEDQTSVPRARARARRRFRDRRSSSLSPPHTPAS
jgi:two-component sensor histidine kinase